MRLNKDLVAASAEPLVLSILAKAESYGYAIIKEVQALSKGQIEWTEGMLYPVLHRLELQGFVKSYWKISETGRKRKYYRIREQGLLQLKSLVDAWNVANEALRASRRTVNV